jgi:hypothetical protein
MNTSEEDCQICSGVPAFQRAGLRDCLIERKFTDLLDRNEDSICDACLKSHWDRCVVPLMPSRANDYDVIHKPDGGYIRVLWPRRD